MTTKEYKTLMTKRDQLMAEAKKEYRAKGNILIGQTTVWPQIEAIDNQIAADKTSYSAALKAGDIRFGEDE